MDGAVNVKPVKDTLREKVAKKLITSHQGDKVLGMS